MGPESVTHSYRAYPAPPAVIWPKPFKSAVVISIDIDAESGILFDHPSSASRLDVQLLHSYGPSVGVPRLLELFAAKGVLGTFFVPGWTAEKWPDAVASVNSYGHEVALHGYMHESIAGMSRQKEEEILVRSRRCVEDIIGRRVVGYRAPKFHLNDRTPELLLEHGFAYDSSLQNADQPYVLAHARSTLVELPVQYALGDWAFFAYLPGYRPNTTIHPPSTAFEVWTAELAALHAYGGLLVLTLHPDLIGRASRISMLGDFIDRVHAMGDVWLTTCSAVAEHVLLSAGAENAQEGKA
jgi:peptidoglycan/xylan/chitin deacetylase (PgdA/CDA1 family)